MTCSGAPPPPPSPSPGNRPLPVQSRPTFLLRTADSVHKWHEPARGGDGGGGRTGACSTRTQEKPFLFPRKKRLERRAILEPVAASTHKPRQRHGWALHPELKSVSDLGEAESPSSTEVARGRDAAAAGDQEQGTDAAPSWSSVPASTREPGTARLPSPTRYPRKSQHRSPTQPCYPSASGGIFSAWLCCGHCCPGAKCQGVRTVTAKPVALHRFNPFNGRPLRLQPLRGAV